MNNEYQTNEEELLAKHLADAMQVIENRNDIIAKREHQIGELIKTVKELRAWKKSHIASLESAAGSQVSTEANEEEFSYDELNYMIRGLGADLQKANERIAELEAKQEWISVQDRLPEIGQKVVLSRDLIERTQEYVTTFDQEDLNWLKMNDVTHWMPIPAPPKQAEQNDKM